jgi:hypothetical protein
VRVAAIQEMFDRGFGKAAQAVEGSLTYGISDRLAGLFRGNAGITLAADREPSLRPLEHGQVEVKELKVVGTERLALGRQALR